MYKAFDEFGFVKEEDGRCCDTHGAAAQLTTCNLNFNLN